MICHVLEVLGDSVDEGPKTVLPGVLDVSSESASQFLLEDFDDEATELLKILKRINLTAKLAIA